MTMGNYDNLFAEAQRTIATVAGVTVNYARGNVSVDVTAVPARSSFDAEGEQIKAEVKSTDFLIAAEDLVLNDIVITPKKDDVITQSSGGKVFTYVVKHPNGINEKPWRYTDTGRSTIRVHTFLSGVA